MNSVGHYVSKIMGKRKSESLSRVQGKVGILKLLFSKKCSSLLTLLAHILSSSDQQGHLMIRERERGKPEKNNIR